MKDLKPETEALWVSLAKTYKTVLEEIENTLKSNDLPQLEVYDVLLEIERAGAFGIRPFELRKQLLLPQYSMSRLLDRLEKQGLIEKTPVENDKRGFIVHLSKEGILLRKRMWPIYSEALRTLIEKHNSTIKIEETARMLESLRATTGVGHN